MKSSKVQTLCVCGCCKRSLPASAFYINKKTGLPGNYCKECRKLSAGTIGRTRNAPLHATGKAIIR